METRPTALSMSLLLGLIGLLGTLVPSTRQSLAVAAQEVGPSSTPAATPPAPPFISSPAAGQNVQGSVGISGSTAVQGFSSYVVEFAYQDDQTRTWFMIQTNNQSVSEGILARWDTQGITDGDYRLRLRVFTAAGNVQRYVVENVRVRNYTAVDTSTPTPTATLTITPSPTATLVATETLTSTPFPTPTSHPANPVIVTDRQIASSVVRGAVAVVALFAIFGLFIRLRRP